MPRSIVLLMLLAACGAPQRPASAPECDVVAAHLLELANRDNDGEASPELAAGIRGEFARECRDEKWSAERRRCLMSAESQEATLDCAVK